MRSVWTTLIAPCFSRGLVGEERLRDEPKERLQGRLLCPGPFKIRFDHNKWKMDGLLWVDVAAFVKSQVIDLKPLNKTNKRKIPQT